MLQGGDRADNETLVIDHHLARLIDDMEAVRCAEAIRSSLNTFIRATPFDYYAYACFGGPEVSVFSNYPPDCRALFFGRHQETANPFAAIARRHAKPFTWTRPEIDRQVGSRLRRPGVSQRGVASGFAIPTPAGFGRTAMLTLATRAPHPAPVVIRDFPRALAAVTLLHINIARICIDGTASIRAKLSGRETVCLSWASVGKTHSEIAQLLGIAESTARHYLTQARDKLGARNITHAVRLAVKQQLI